MLSQVMFRPAGRNITRVGLSLTGLLPAAAWYFAFIECRFAHSTAKRQ
jgi:hypothetical protein